ncbi:glycosyltransferase family 4 protein [Colwelliaceae bacterium 6471]
MKKIVFVTAAPETITAFLSTYINEIAKIHDVHVATSLKDDATISGLNQQITLHNIAIARNPNIAQDIRSLLALFQFFRREQFDVVHSVTPKAGLLSQLGAFAARVPLRFHTFTGQVWVTKTGLARYLLKTLDKITANFASFCLVDSPSQQDFLIKEKLLTHNNSRVLAQGSISGINLEKFRFSEKTRQSLRQLHHIAKEDFVFLFVGRLKADKGIPELVQAFKQLVTEKTVKLVIIGNDEEQLAPLLSSQDNIHYLGFKNNVNDYYSFADVLCLPSHREGFGNVIIEAAACNLPAIAANIYGLSDAVEPGYSGMLHQVKNPEAILNCMTACLNDEKTLNEMRVKARIRVEQQFDEQLLVTAFLGFYQEFLPQ